jgi:hypothetical protein
MVPYASQSNYDFLKERITFNLSPLEKINYAFKHKEAHMGYSFHHEMSH